VHKKKGNRETKLKDATNPMQRRKDVHTKAKQLDDDFIIFLRGFYLNRHKVKAIRNFSDHI